MIKNWSCAAESSLSDCALQHLITRPTGVPGISLHLFMCRAQCARSCFSNKVGRFMPWNWWYIRRAAMGIVCSSFYYTAARMSDERSADCILTFQLVSMKGGAEGMGNWMLAPCSNWLGKCTSSVMIAHILEISEIEMFLQWILIQGMSGLKFYTQF
jgi:hypothetical protein